MRYYVDDEAQGPPASESLQDVIGDIRTAFQEEREQRRSSSADISALLELYGSITSLCARAERIRDLLTARIPVSETADHGDQQRLDELSPGELREFDGFHHELIEFGTYLTSVNLAAIDIFFPGLRDDLLSATGADADFDRQYVEVIAPRYGLSDRTVPPTLAAILDRYSGDWGPRNIGGQLMWEFGSDPEQGNDPWHRRPDTPPVVSRAGMLRILDLLRSCRAEIRRIVQENWQFTDLLRRRPEGGTHFEMTEYHITGSQVGAVGPGGHAHDLHFQQINADPSGIDAAALADELDRLRDELARVASERDHYADLVALSDAASAAHEGNTKAAISKLAAVGKWAFDTASKIGVTVAAEAIKRATGLA